MSGFDFRMVLFDVGRVGQGFFNIRLLRIKRKKRNSKYFSRLLCKSIAQKGYRRVQGPSFAPPDEFHTNP